MKAGRYLIRESEPNTKLHFIGKDADRFEQVNAPTGERCKSVDFGLTVDYIRTEFPTFLPMYV